MKSSVQYSPTVVFIITLFITFSVSLQNAEAQISEETPIIRTFEDSRRAFAGDSSREYDGEAKRFARWQYRMETRLLPGGVLPPADILLTELKKYEAQQSKTMSNNRLQTLPSRWMPLGPLSFAFTGGINGGKGRINVLRFHPQDTTILFAGTPDGGLWKTTDEGVSWTPLTDNLPSLGVTDLAIDSKRPATMFIATGDARAAAMYGNPYSYGLLKTTDGGASWSPTGLIMDLSQRILITRVVISPSNSNIILVGIFSGNDRGIYRSIDGGKTFAKKDGGAIYDIQYCPDDPSLVYASGYGNFRRSTDGGETWTAVTSVLPTWVANSVSRTAIAVTKADPNVVYVIYVSQKKNQIYGLYRSNDRGQSFKQMMDTTAFPLWGNYGEYNLVLAVSSTDPNTVIVGEQLLAKSTDGGATWNRMNNAIHWDNHALLFAPRNGDVFYSGNDGGVYRTTDVGDSWTPLSDSLQITQYYRLGCAAQDARILYSGAQDNGIHGMAGEYWYHTLSGADGGECLVDYSDSQIIYMENQNGALYRSTDGGNSIRGIAPSTNGHWITPYIIHPTRPQTIYAAYRNVYKSDNRGDSWTAISPQLSGNDNIKSLALAPSNDSVIYAGTYVRLYATTNAGASWQNVTAGSPTGDTAALTYICVSPTNPRKVWLTFSGFTDHKHVYYSTDGGTSWQNITGTLPNVPVNTIVYENGSKDGVYIGTDVGVFYRDSTMSDWVRFSTGLPNVSVSELEIVEANGMLRAATFGRGIWESPIAGLTAPTMVGLRQPVNTAVNVLQRPQFVWNTVQRTLMYELQVAYDSLFNTIVVNTDSLYQSATQSEVRLDPGTRYFWRVRAVNTAGPGPWSDVWSFTTSGINDIDDNCSIDQLHLSIVPNPTGDDARVEFELRAAAQCEMKIFSINGEEVATLIHRELASGSHHISVPCEALVPGTYFVRLNAGRLQTVKVLTVW